MVPKKDRPMCQWCEKKPARWGKKHYCSQRCAALDGDTYAEYSYKWCQACFDTGKDIGHGIGWLDIGHDHDEEPDLRRRD